MRINTSRRCIRLSPAGLRAIASPIRLQFGFGRVNGRPGDVPRLVRASCLDSVLSARIEIAHDDAEHLTGESSLTFGHLRVRAQLAIGVG